MANDDSVRVRKIVGDGRWVEVDELSTKGGQGVVYRVAPHSAIRLELGDFGIVFFEDPQKTRVTELLEKVGSRDWMPPWTHTGWRLENVPANFDVYALAKVLWAMIAGQLFLPREFWSRPEYDLRRMFPNSPEMAIINESNDELRQPSLPTLTCPG